MVGVLSQRFSTHHSRRAPTSTLGDPQFLNYVVVVVPALIRLFWGAPLVSRELETGAFRLAWTQSVTRTRWLAVKLAAAGLAAMAVAGLVVAASGMLIH